MNKFEEIKSEIETKLDLIKDRAIILNKISVKTWLILGIFFAFFSAFWEWIVGWLGHLVLGRTFFIYPFSSLKYTSYTGIITWGLFTTICAFIAMQATRLDTIVDIRNNLKENSGQVVDFLKNKFVLPKRLTRNTILTVGFAGAIVGTTCEGLWGYLSQFVRGHISWIYPHSMLKYTSFASIPIWGIFSVIFFLLAYNLILLLEKKQFQNG